MSDTTAVGTLHSELTPRQILCFNNEVETVPDELFVGVKLVGYSAV